MMMFLPEFTHPLWLLSFAALLGYLLGSVPFGLVMARLFNLGDLRQIGSGNIGATNVLRTGSKTAAFLTLLLDAGKAGAAVLITRATLGEDAAQIAGFAALVGHCYPLWLGFRGGKGVATYYGLLIALAWPIGLAAGVVWLLVAAVMRYSSLAALTSSALTPIVAMFLGYSPLGGLCLALAVLIYWRHRENITRLVQGSEGKIGGK